MLRKLIRLSLFLWKYTKEDVFSSIKRFRTIKRLGTNVKGGESARTCAEARYKFALCTTRAPAGNRAVPRRSQGQDASFRRSRSRFDPARFTTGANIVLQLNVSKCEIIFKALFDPVGSLAGFSTMRPTDGILLGALLIVLGSAADHVLEARCSVQRTVIARLKISFAHDALILLRYSFSAPKVLYTIRCTPCDGHRLLGTNVDLSAGASQLSVNLTLRSSVDPSQFQFRRAGWESDVYLRLPFLPFRHLPRVRLIFKH